MIASTVWAIFSQFAAGVWSLWKAVVAITSRLDASDMG
jgi:hypothetical protein